MTVAKTDYQTDVTITFQNNTQILSEEVVNQNPIDLAAETRLVDNAVHILPVLLNPTDSLTIKMLLSGFSGGPHFHARISGIKSIKRRIASRRGVLLIVASSYTALAGSYIITTHLHWHEVIGLGLLAIGIIGFVATYAYFGSKERTLRTDALQTLRSSGQRPKTTKTK